MRRQALETEQKALEINLNDKIYGTFSEIGAGQEVARYFFQVGAAAGTIAKTMSAYDKVYSDKIYGTEASGRYVCESRVYKMLDHEYGLMLSRLRHEKPETNFFVFADTVAAINYQKTIKGHGWLGLRFQLYPNREANEIVLHVNMQDNDNGLQQQAIGILGVNLVYACFHYHNDPEILVQSLMDHLHGRLNIDMLRLSGPDFKSLDNRLLSLWLVKHNMCDVAMFNAEGKNIHSSEFLYKKHLMVVRGSYRPATLVNQDMLNKSFEQFKKDEQVEAKKTFFLVEITLDNLKKGGLDEKDFLDRAAVLGKMGYTVMISNCEDRHKLFKYFEDYKIKKLGIGLGVNELLSIINEKYFQNQNDSLLSAFGELFRKNVKLYAYPAFQEGSGELMTTKNLPIPKEIEFIYKYLLDSNSVVDVEGFEQDYLHIYSTEVLRMIQENEEGWEKMVPEYVATLVKEKFLFNYPCETMEFEY